VALRPDLGGLRHGLFRRGKEIKPKLKIIGALNDKPSPPQVRGQRRFGVVTFMIGNPFARNNAEAKTEEFQHGLGVYRGNGKQYGAARSQDAQNFLQYRLRMLKMLQYRQQRNRIERSVCERKSGFHSTSDQSDVARRNRIDYALINTNPFFQEMSDVKKQFAFAAADV